MLDGGKRKKHDGFTWKIGNLIALIMLADFLFYKHSVGWTASLFALCLVLSHLVYNAKRLNHIAWLFITLCFGMVAALTENPSTLAIIMFWTSFIASISAIRQHKLRDLKHWMSPSLKLALFPVKPVIRSMIALNRKYSSEAHNGQAYRFAQEWAIPIILSLAFITLFTIANPVVSKWLSNIRWDGLSGLLSPLRWVFWFVFLCISWTFIRPKLSIRRKNKKLSQQSRLENRSGFFSKQSITISLILFNLIFFIQTVMDLYFLWGGATLPHGLTYAEYAHRGAFPLIFTALLAAVFVLFTFKPGTRSERDSSIRTLVLLWIAQNIILVISSIWRTTLYVEVYSLTYLRVAALIWMGLVAIGLFFILIRIFMRRNNDWLLLVNAATAFITLYICCFLNFADIIARYNVAHSLELSGQGNKLDVYYLNSLGVNALPAIDVFTQAGGRLEYSGVNNSYSIDPRGVFHEKITADWRNWRTRTFRLYRLKNYLEEKEERERS